MARIHDQVNLIDELLAGAAGYRRLRVDDGEAGFFEGRQFRIAYEFEFSSPDVIYIELISTVDFIVTHSALDLDQGGVRYSMVTGGTPSGTFGTAIPVIAKNAMAVAPSYTSGITVATGGTVAGGSDTILSRVRTASGQNSRASHVSSDAENRGYSAGMYYLKIEELAGVNDVNLGILSIEWEDRP